MKINVTPLSRFILPPKLLIKDKDVDLVALREIHTLYQIMNNWELKASGYHRSGHTNSIGHKLIDLLSQNVFTHMYRLLVKIIKDTFQD